MTQNMTDLMISQNHIIGVKHLFKENCFLGYCIGKEQVNGFLKKRLILSGENIVPKYTVAYFLIHSQDKFPLKKKARQEEYLRKLATT